MAKQGLENLQKKQNITKTTTSGAKANLPSIAKPNLPSQPSVSSVSDNTVQTLVDNLQPKKQKTTTSPVRDQYSVASAMGNSSANRMVNAIQRGVDSLGDFIRDKNDTVRSSAVSSLVGSNASEEEYQKARKKLSNTGGYTASSFGSSVLSSAGGATEALKDVATSTLPPEAVQQTREPVKEIRSGEYDVEPQNSFNPIKQLTNWSYENGFTDRFINAMDNAGNWLYGQADDIAQRGMEQYGQYLTPTERATSELIANVGTNVLRDGVALMAGGVVGNGAVGVLTDLMMGLPAYGEALRDAREKGLEGADARKYALINAGIEVGSEHMFDLGNVNGYSLGLEDLISNAINDSSLRPFSKYLMHQAASVITEGGEEFFASLARDATDKAMLDQEKGLGQSFMDAGTAFMQGAMSAFLLSGLRGNYSDSGYERFRAELALNYLSMSDYDKTTAVNRIAELYNVNPEMLEREINAQAEDSLKGIDADVLYRALNHVPVAVNEATGESVYEYVGQMDKDQKTAVRMAKRLGNAYLAEDLGDDERGRPIAGMTLEDGTVLVSARAEDPVSWVMAHEGLHQARGKQGWDDFIADANIQMREVMGESFQRWFDNLNGNYARYYSNINAPDASLSDAEKKDYYIKEGQRLYQEDPSFKEKMDEEVAAYYVQRNLLHSDESMRRFLNTTGNVAQRVYQSLRDTVRGFGKDLTPEEKSLADMEKRFGEIIRENKVAARNGIKVASDESVYQTRYSRATWEALGEEGKKNLAHDVASSIGVTDEEAEKWLQDINTVSAAIGDAETYLDYEPNKAYSALKNDSDYTYTVDMSTLCKKRILLSNTIEEIQKKLPDVVLTGDDYIRIRQMMKDKNYEVACGFCYVESRRKFLDTVAQQFIDVMRGAEPAKAPNKRQVALTDELRNKDNYIPNLYDLTTPTGSANLMETHPDVYSTFVSFNNARGQNRVKLVETRTEYNGEIRKITDTKFKEIQRHGGLRLQSYSDFETPHLIDMMQIVADMSARGFKSQAYTKVPNFADAFGKTGVKINESLVVLGVDENGQLIFDDVEGMPHDIAFALRQKHSENVGTVIVGKDDATILAAFADPRIDYIIPFHSSGWKNEEYENLGINGYKDYTGVQTERDVVSGKTLEEQLYPADYWDYSVSGDENSKRYLRLCEETGRIPKFDNFLTKDNEGHWVAPSGYWKTLIDFKMYDNDGNGVEQRVVTPTFDNQVNQRILKEYIDEQSNGDPYAPKMDIVNDFIKEKGYDTKFAFTDREQTSDTFDDGESDGRGVSSETGNDINDNASFEDAFSNALFSLSPNEWDDLYFDAIDRNDMNAVQRLRDEHAREGGVYDPSRKLYHGTNKFGWTEYQDRQHEVPFIYTSDNPTVAAHYAGDSNYAFRRNLGKPYSGASDLDSIIQDAQSVWGTNYRVMSDADRQSTINEVINTYIDGVSDKLNELYTDKVSLPSTGDEYEDNRLANVVAWIPNAIWTVDGFRDDLTNLQNVDRDYWQQMSDSLTEDYEQHEKNLPILREYYGEHRDELNDDTKRYLQYLLGYDLGDAVIYTTRIAKALADKDMLINETGNISDPEDVRKSLDAIHNIGAYTFYGDRGENPYYTDANGSQFYALQDPNVSDTYTNTDAVSKWASDNGYSSIVMDNIYDYGDKAQNNVFFDPKAIKLADAITYDDNGNIIPLSQRDNPNKGDIRYSLGEQYPSWEDVPEQEGNWGYHAGDLGKAESRGSQSYDRGTGHFGTGTYFVGNPSELRYGEYGKRPIESVDFSQYNLFKPKNSDDAYTLHDFLRLIDGGVAGMDYHSDEELQSYRNRVFDLLDDEDAKLLGITSTFAEDLITQGRAIFGDAFSDVLEDASRWSGQQLNEDMSDAELANLAPEEVLEAIVDNTLDTSNASWRFKNNQKLTRQVNDLIGDVAKIFDRSPEEIQNLARQIDTLDLDRDRTYTDDSLATRFMKALGYEGVDTRNIPNFDNTRYGSVIYDLKGNDLARKQANGARFSLSEDYNEKFTDRDGRVYINDVNALTNSDWKTIQKAVDKLGYGIGSAEAAKEVFSRYVPEYGFNAEQSDAIRKAFGVAGQKIKNTNPERATLAKKEFGTTGNFNEAGYLLQDGKMLDFSGKREGGSPNTRAMDHREINRVFDEAGDGSASWFMNHFIDEGNIRLMPERGVTIGEIEPTAAQYSVLKRYIEHVLDTNGDFGLDISNEQGYTIASREYSSGDKASRIINDIKAYFKDGELPYRSQFADFMYSLSEDIPEQANAFPDRNVPRDRSAMRTLGSIYRDQDRSIDPLFYEEVVPERMPEPAPRRSALDRFLDSLADEREANQDPMKGDGYQLMMEDEEDLSTDPDEEEVAMFQSFTPDNGGHGANRAGAIMGFKDLAKQLDYMLGKDTEQRAWARENLEKPHSEAQGRWTKGHGNAYESLHDICERLGIWEGTKESAATQWLGEGVKRENGEEKPYTLEDLKKEFPDKWQNIVELEQYTRQTYKDYISKVNAMRKEIYGDPNERHQKDVDKWEADIRSNKNLLNASTNANDIQMYTDIINDLQRKVDDTKKKIKNHDYEVGKFIIPRQNYFHHFRDAKDAGVGTLTNLLATIKANDNADAGRIDPQLVTISEYTKPKTRWQGALQRRGKGEYTADAVGGLRRYIDSMEYALAYDPLIAHNRDVVNRMIKATRQTKNANTLIDYLSEWTNSIAGKTSPFDRFIIKNIGNAGNRGAILNALEKINQRGKANAVVGNIRSALAQPFNIPNARSIIKSDSAWLKGIKDYYDAKLGNRELLDQSPFLAERYQDLNADDFKVRETILEKLGGKTNDIMSKMMEFGDREAAELIWLSAYNEAVEKGVDDKIFYADDMTRRSIGGRGVGETPYNMKSRLANFIMPFQLESNNQWQNLKHMVEDKDAAGVFRLMMATYLMNAIPRFLFNDNVLPDVLDALVQGIKKLFDKDREETVGEVLGETAQGIAGETVSMIPGASLWLPLLMGDNAETFFGDSSPTRYGTGAVGLKNVFDVLADAVNGDGFDAMTPLLQLGLPVGGKQASRFYNTLQDFNVVPSNGFMNTPIGGEKNPVNGDYTKKGALKYTLPEEVNSADDAMEIARAFLFGSNATNSAQEYYETGKPALTAEKVAKLREDPNLDAELYMQYLKEANADGNGGISQQEASEWISSHNLTKDEADALWNATNSNWKKSYEDYSSKDTGNKSGNTGNTSNNSVPKNKNELAKLADSNGNGTLTQAEAWEWLSKQDMPEAQKASIWRNCGWKTSYYDYKEKHS